MYSNWQLVRCFRKHDIPANVKFKAKDTPKYTKGD